jgi:hypothetical protein
MIIWLYGSAGFIRIGFSIRNGRVNIFVDIMNNFILLIYLAIHLGIARQGEYQGRERKNSPSDTLE